VITALTLQSCPLGKSHDAATQATAPGKARPHTQNWRGSPRAGWPIVEAEKTPRRHCAIGTSQQNGVPQLSDVGLAIDLEYGERLRAVQKQISKFKSIFRSARVQQELKGGVN
jgi:hypothetical protein